MALAAGSRIAHYEILGPLGKGGMGEVFRAKDTKLGREVAVKVLRRRHRDQVAQIEQFLREGRMVPDAIVDPEPHEPAKQNAVVDLFHQQPLAANRVERLQQERPQQSQLSPRRNI